MKKLLALVLVMVITVLFAACGDSKDESTTLDPLYTAYSPVATNAQNQNGGTGATYVLTTNQGKTAPALNTTRFSIGVAATAPTQSTSATTTTDYNTTSNTNAVITVPVVSTTRAITTTWATIATTTTTTTQTTTKKLTTNTTTRATTTAEPTTKAEPEAVYISINEVGVDSSGRVYAAIDSEGWGGKLKSNSQRVSVYVDGVEMEEQVMLQISSSTTGDGYQYVYLDLEKYEVDPSSSTITFEIPEGFLENKTGTKYNMSAEVAM